MDVRHDTSENTACGLEVSAIGPAFAGLDNCQHDNPPHDHSLPPEDSSTLAVQPPEEGALVAVELAEMCQGAANVLSNADEISTQCGDGSLIGNCSSGNSAVGSPLDAFRCLPPSEVVVSCLLAAKVEGAHLLDEAATAGGGDDDLLSALDQELSSEEVEQTATPSAASQQIQQQQRLIESLQEANRRLVKQLTSTSEERDRLESTHSTQQSELRQQLSSLQKIVSDQSQEVRVLKEALTVNEVSARVALLDLKQQHQHAMEQVSRRYQDCKEEKESMVVKYAQAERKTMQQQTAMEKMENKLVEKEREKELLVEKVKAAKAEKQKLADSFDERNSELHLLKKDLEKQKEAVSSLDYKQKWAQNRLKSELDAHKETKQKLDETTRKLTQVKEEAEQIRRNCQEMIKTYQESEEIKSNSLDLELKKKETELKVHLMEKENTSEVLTLREKELESLKVLCKERADEAAALIDKAQRLESAQSADEKTLSDLRSALEHQRQENADVQQKLQQCTALERRLEKELISVEQITKQVGELQLANSELQAEMDACRLHQNELLELTQKMTEQNAGLLSENSSLQARLVAHCLEHGTLESTLAEMETTNKKLFKERSVEKEQRESELKATQLLLEERERVVEALTSELEDLRCENKTLRKKQALSVKELTRELQLLRKKVDSYEGQAATTDKSNGVLTNHSRTNSVGSADAIDGALIKGEWVVVNARQSTLQQQPSSFSSDLASSAQLLPEMRFVEPDKQKLIEKVVKLQRSLARGGEKVEFLEDHIKQLVEELQKKSRIIQLYVMREDTGSSEADYMDKQKEQLAKKGGSTATPVASLPSDGRISLELSLEMNHKLQAILEDTLLKNMTLKENMDTLGREIARLSEANKELKSPLLQPQTLDYSHPT